MPKFMAVYVAAPRDTPPDMKPEDMQRGMAAWHGWMEKHKDILIDPGGPLGKTKEASKAGIKDNRNAMTGYTIFEASDHDAAVALFREHPHFSIFPGESVQVMEVKPIPTSM